MRDNNVIGNQAAAAAQNLEARDYWLNKLAGELVKSTFPCDYKKEKKPGQAKPFETISFEFAGELFDQLMKLSNGFDYSLHMILVAGVTVLLEKYTGTRDIILGAPIYKQEVNAAFINTILAIRNKIEPHMTFKELLLQVRQTFLEATRNQNYPIETLLYQLDIESSPDEFPLFDIAVLLENVHDKEYIRHIPLNMFFSFRRAETEVIGKVEYNPLLYDVAMINRIILHFKHFMQTALFNVDVKVEALEILSRDEKRQLLYDFNDTRQEYPEDKTLVDLFAEQACGQPQAAALWFAGKRLTYGELDQRSHCLSRLLVQKGVKPETIVGLMVERSFEMVIGMLGILRAGGAYLPVDSQHPGERIKYILNDSGAQLLLTQQHLENRLTIDVESIDLMDETIYSTAPVETERAAAALPSHLAYVIYTSGSTGKAKGVAVEHGSIVNTLLWRKDYYDFNPKDVILQILGFTFDSSVEDIFTTLISGGALVLVPQGSVYDLQYLKKLIMETGVTYFLIVPGFYKSFLEEIPDALKGLRAITVAADNMTEKLVKRHFQLLENMRLYNEYGPTENSVCSTVYEFSPTRTKVLIGKPIHNVTCYILNANDRLNPIGVPGELCVSGKGLARGYWKRPQLSKEKFVKNPFFAGERMYRTGDLAKWLPDGNIEFLGRIDYQVKIRGFRIELGEIESQLLKYEGIKEAVVTAVEGLSEGEKYLCAYIVAETKVDASNLRDTLLRTLPEYMIPAFFIQLEQMPLTPNGKIDRKVLPKPEAGAAEEYIAPRDLIEEKMVNIWSDVLKIEKERLGINANFFDSGGHSLKATVLVSRIHKEFNARLPVAKIFETPTVRGLAEFIKKAAEEAFTSIQPAEEKNYYALSPAQKRLYILQQMEPGAIAYNIHEVVQLEGEVDREKLVESFRHLINRHESLRTSFRIIAGRPVQKVHNKNEVDFEIQYYNEVEHVIRPFDLSRAPLLRVGLVKMAETNHILVVDMHHIISDGVSHKLFIENFISLYEGRCLPPLRLQYKDYSEWLQSPGVKEALKQQEVHWLQEFAGEPPVLNLPTDFPRPAVQSFEGKIFTFEICEQESKALDEISRCQEATLFMALLAVFNIFLAKLSSQEDIVVGVPIAGRQHADLQQIIGMFVNTLPLRSYPVGEKTFLEFLSEVKEKLLAAFENQNYQFEELVEKVAVERDMSRNPLFDTMFMLEDIFEEPDQVSEYKLAGLTLKPYKHEHKIAKFDLTLSAFKTADKLRFTFEYCSKLFEEAAIERFTHYFKEVFSAVSGDPGTKISGIEIITEKEKRQVLYGFNDTGTEYPKDKFIQQLFEEQVERTPDNIAVLGPSISTASNVRIKNGGESSLTYRELNRKSNELAGLLREKAVQPDTIVGIMFDRSIEMISAILGILKAGGAFLPIDPDYPGERIRYMLADSSAKILLSELSELSGWEGEILHPLSSPAWETPLSRGELLREEFDESEKSLASLAYVIYTSGTTGNPKGVFVEHKNVVCNLFAFFNEFEIKPEDTVVQLTSYSFDAFIEEVFPVLLRGGKIAVLGKFDVLDINRLAGFIINHDVNIIDCTPLLLNELNKLNALDCIDTVISGGDVLKKEYIDNFLKSAHVYNTYGPTETTVCVTYHRYFRNDKPEIPIGKPIKNYKVYIKTEKNELLPVGIPGELCVSGPGVTRGYLNKQELTLEKFITNPFEHEGRLYRTGDLARWRPDGSIELLGRIDRQVKIRGFRVEPGEVENRLLNHDQIREAVVLSKENKRGSKHLCAYIAADKTCDASQLKEYLSKELPEYMVPLYFKQIEKIPLTPNGKVDRKTLASYDMELDTGVAYAPPKNETEEIIAGLWEEILTVDNVGVNDNFFDLGGNSLNIIELKYKLEEVMGKEIPVVNLFRYPTICSLSRYLNREDTGEAFSDQEIKESVEMMEDTMQMLMGEENE